MHLERNGRRSFSSGLWSSGIRAVYGIGPGETHGRGWGPPACTWDNNNIVLCVLNCSISTNRHHVCQCCHHDDHHSFTMDTRYLSASAKVGVTSITLNLSHFSSLPSWQRQCFGAFPSLSPLTREKKIPEELCLSPPTALAHQSQSLSEDKINSKFYLYNQ